MKKLLFLLPILILGISAAVWQNYQNEPTLSDTALANIEALAGDGGGGEVSVGSLCELTPKYICMYPIYDADGNLNRYDQWPGITYGEGGDGAFTVPAN